MCARLHELGARLESADDIARFVQMKGNPVLDEIRSRFGIGVIDNSGELDRAALGRLVFEDADARRDLEAIVHPAIGREFRARTAAHYASDSNAIIVYDIPLLIETDRMDEFDSIVVLSCDPAIRHRRLVELRGLSSEEADARIAAQATEDQRLSVADFVIDTSGTVDETLRQVGEVWADLVAAYRA